MSKLRSVTEQNENILADLEQTKAEVSRLRQVERLAVQMREWQQMMEDNAKMAAEMQNLVQSFTRTSMTANDGKSNETVNHPPSAHAPALNTTHSTNVIIDAKKKRASLAVLDQDSTSLKMALSNILD